MALVFFTQIARIQGKQVISGDSSKVMVSWASKLGVELVCETGIQTINRGIQAFGVTALVLVSFLWAVAKDVLKYCVQQDLRFLVYDTYQYFPGASKLKEYGSGILRGTKGIGWLNIPFNLSEDRPLKGDKPMLTEIVKGPIFFDSAKGVRQISMYSEMYPGKIDVSSWSLIPSDELYEMSVIHNFNIVDARPVIWFVRCPHNSGNGISYDLDTWQLIPWTVKISDMIIGSVSAQSVIDLFVRDMNNRPLVDKPRVGRPGIKQKKKGRAVDPYIVDREFISNSSMWFRRGNKYYVKSACVIRPPPAVLYDDGDLKLVWLKAVSYIYELHDSDPNKGFVSYSLKS